MSRNRPAIPVPCHYGWVIVFSGVWTLFACLGLARFAFGMLLPAMRTGLGLGFDQMGLISTGNFAGYLLSVAATPWLLRRTGPRRLIAEAFAPPAAWGPGQAFATLREVLPAATVATADSGAHRILLSQMWRCPAPRTLLQSSALCTMGCAVPIAAGYKLARPQVPVVAFVGDAGLEMVLGELATLRDLGLAVIIVVLVDASLALIEMKQRNSQLANVGVDFGATDFAAVAAAFGGHGALIDDAGTLRREAADALARHDRFSLLAVRIPRRAYDGTF
jgi:acetolactate synthase-1/2/3 large subunit